MGPVEVVFVNIALNSGWHQTFNTLVCDHQRTDVRGTVRHERHLQGVDARVK